MRSTRTRMNTLLQLPLALGLALGMGTTLVANSQDPGSRDEVQAKKVKRTWKTELGKLAPEFELTDTSGAKWKLSDKRGKIVVLEWFNPECPVVKKAHGVGGALEELGNDAVKLAGPPTQ